MGNQLGQGHEKFQKPPLNKKWKYTVPDFDCGIQVSFGDLKNKKLFKKLPD